METLTVGYSVGLSLLLFEYTVCQTQNKPYVITDAIKTTELRPDRSLVSFYEHVKSWRTLMIHKAVAGHHMFMS